MEACAEAGRQAAFTYRWKGIGNRLSFDRTVQQCMTLHDDGCQLAGLGWWGSMRGGVGVEWVGQNLYFLKFPATLHGCGTQVADIGSAVLGGLAVKSA
jgi:hypothetical protein